MLEEQTLLLGPWAANGSARPIVAADTGRSLGVVRRQQAAGPWWLRWLSGPVLAVHEADDEPLLFTIQRTWGLARRREVRDADGRLVGLLHGDQLLDPYNGPLAVRERGADGTARFRTRRGLELAVLSREEGRTRLAFAPELAGEPLLKMILLAAVLVEE